MENVNTDLPLYRFCILFLIGSKYDRSLFSEVKNKVNSRLRKGLRIKLDLEIEQSA
jgi:hypothetical protein